MNYGIMYSKLQTQNRDRTYNPGPGRLKETG